MIAPEKIAAIVLAAGASTRFGSDKLLHVVDGKLLAAHIAGTLAAMPFAHRIAVVATGNEKRADIFASRGFDVIANPDASAGLSSSLALGAGMAAALGASAILVCLADMPFVTPEHIEALMAEFRGKPVATVSESVRTPPAIFPSGLFAELMALTGDRGAKALLDGAEVVEADAAMVRDIDTLADLA